MPAVHRQPGMSCQAEAKGSKSPVKELEEKVSKVLGRKLKKGDLVWTYQAQRGASLRGLVSCSIPSHGSVQIGTHGQAAADKSEKADLQVRLPASEISDTFPVNVPQNGQNVKVRVLSKERGTVVTMREGSLERPEKENVKVDFSAVENVDRTVKMPAEARSRKTTVLGFTFDDAAVKVTGADGKVTLAQLPRKQFTEGAEKEME
eukprot:Skav200523  [mRNA]  locus=scaffold450:599689:602485:- [translate_table: standard]